MNSNSRIKGWLDGGEAPPSSIQLQPSNTCNLNCRQCARNFESIRKDGMSDERTLEIIDEAGDMGVEEFEFTGRVGEPLMRDLDEALVKVKEHGMEGNLLTNGTLLDKDLCKKLVEIEWDSMVFSVDAPYASIHDNLRGRSGTFQEIVESIKEINRWKEEMNSSKPTLLFLAVLNRYNWDKLTDLVELGGSLNIDAIQIRPMIVHSESSDSLNDILVDPENTSGLSKSIDNAIERASDLGIEIILEHDKEEIINYIEGGYERGSTKKYDDKDSEELKEDIEKCSSSKSEEDVKCLLPFSDMVIFAEGTVTPCCVVHSPEPGKYVDSVVDKSLSEVWYGDKFGRFRESMLNGDIPECCEGCFL